MQADENTRNLSKSYMGYKVRRVETVANSVREIPKFLEIPTTDIGIHDAEPLNLVITFSWVL